MLPAFTCTRAIGNLWSICLGTNISNHVATSEGPPLPCVNFIGNILLLKALRVNSRPL